MEAGGSSGRGSKFGAKTKRNLLTDEEVSRLVTACENGVESLVVKTLLYTGMRISEFVHMRKSWINWKGGFIQIPESQPCLSHYECRRSRTVIDWSTGERVKVKNMWRVKVPEAARAIPILPEVEPVLKKFFRDHNSVSEVVQGRVEAWKIIRSAAKKAGLKKRIFPHVLRGTFASILAGKDFDGLSIQALLGWKSIKTADEYVRLSPQRLVKMMKEKW
jgi:integrase